MTFMVATVLSLPARVMLAGPAGPSHAPTPTWIWWEAEAPTSSNFPEQNPFAPVDAKAAKALSGGKWIGAFDPGKPLFAEYQVAVAEGAPYRFYVRKFWQHGPFRWRFDDQAWRECGRDVALLDEVSLSETVNASWVDLGIVKLGTGKHTLRLELSDVSGAAAFDCFLLTRGPFVARGTLKPGEKYGRAPEGWFAFEPDSDSFAPAALDLRALNEKFSGEGGFIQVKGGSFVHEKTGQPLRFWGVTTGHEILSHDTPTLDRFARRLAKVGVNIVRLHGPLWRDDDVTRIDATKIARLHRLVAALKRAGIYLSLSTYFPLWMRPKGVPGLEGFNGDQHPFAIPFFNKRFQDIQKGWWRSALTPKNPETGLTLLEDPTLAFIEIVNEDGMFFWTFSPYDNVPAAQMQLLEQQFGQWLVTRYGGLERAFAKWGSGTIKGDALAAGRAGFMPLWEMAKGHSARASDTAEFLTELQRRYYDASYSFLKKDLGFKGSVTGSNWVTADARVLGPLDKWSNTGCDFMDRHGYFGGPHEGPQAGYLLSKGDRYNDASALRFETGKNGDKSGDKNGETSFELPIMDLAYNGKPSTISEINWVTPNRFRAEMPVLAAAYGALQGSDAFFFFATADLEAPGQLSKFGLADPVGMAQFPATALIFRKGLVKTADVALRVETQLSDLYRLEGLPIFAPENLDALGRQHVPAGGRSESSHADSIDPLVFLAGRVEINVSQSGGVSKSTSKSVSTMADLSKQINHQTKTVLSTTGELRWNYGRGLVTVDAPAAQGATGFLSQAGNIALGDITIASAMEYGSVLLVSLDDRPLATSRRMVLQVMSEDNNFGWSAPPGKGLRTIAELGGPPIVVRNLAGTVALRRADAATLEVTPLDFNGYPDARSPPARRARNLTLLPSTFYYLIGN